MNAETRPLVCVLDDWDGMAERLPVFAELQRVADVVVLAEASEDEVADVAREAEVIIPMRERRAITSSLLERLPNLRHIAQTGGGSAHVDRKAVAARGIELSLTPGASAGAVAELVLGLIIAAERGIVTGAAALTQNRWERPLGRELGRRSLGVLGAGATGLAVAQRAAGLGMRVLVSSRRHDVQDRTGFENVPLPELCRRADIVSVHIESSEATRGLVHRAHLRAIGPGGGLVNTARAPIVDQDDLRAALDVAELGWAALDVFTTEPPDDDPLVGHERVLATPHLGWRTTETLERYLDGALRNALAHLESPDPSER